MSTLVATDVSVHFGGVRAVSEVDLQVETGEILGVVGPNGSGKTTLLNALTGLVPAQGVAELDGHRLNLRDPRAIRAASVLRLFQAPQTLDELSVLENVCLSTAQRRRMGLTSAIFRRPSMLRLERLRTERAHEALETVGAAHLADVEGAQLTYGQRRLVDLARAIGGDPRVLMLDEPSAGLNDVETKRISRILMDLASQGVTIIVVDHKVGFLNDLCDRLMAMRDGQRIGHGTPADVWRDKTVAEAYLGGGHADD